MLDSNNFGYAVMGKDLNSYSFEDESLEVCKRYCRGTDVIVEQIKWTCLKENPQLIAEIELINSRTTNFKTN